MSAATVASIAAERFAFLAGRGRLTDPIARRVRFVARAHGAEFVHVNTPGEGWSYGFWASSRGAVLDGAVRAEVARVLRAQGLLHSDGRTLGNFPEEV